MNHSLNPRFRWLYGSVVSSGLSILALAVYTILQGQVTGAWLILSCLALAAGCFSLKIPGMNGRVSAGDTIICMSLMLFGPVSGAVTAALDGLAGSLRCQTKSRRLHFVLYNSSSMALSAFIGGQAFQVLLGRSPLYHQPEVDVASMLLPLGVLAVLYFAANTLLVAGAVALENAGKTLTVWREGFQWTCVNYLAGASVAGILIRIPNPFTVRVIATALIASGVVYVSSRAHLRLADEVQLLRERIVVSCASPDRHSVVMPRRGRIDDSTRDSFTDVDGEVQEEAHRNNTKLT